jgi:hypothetical protein
MIAAAIACCVLVLLAWLHYVHAQRSLAERAVDWLYGLAAAAYAAAQAADAALVRYREARAEIRHSHVPMYAEARR